MASQAITDLTQLVGMVKETYAKREKDARVNFTVLQDLFPVDIQDAVGGNFFRLPILLTQSQSTMYDTAGGVRTFDPTYGVVAPISQEAQIPAFEVTERMQISFGTVGKLEQGSAVSFITTQTLKMLALNKAVKRQLEWSLLYGGLPVATLSSASTATGPVVYSLVAGSFGAGYMIGCENQWFDAWDVTGATKRVGPYQCSAIDIEANTITLTCQGGATASAIVSTDNLWRFNCRLSNAVSYEMVGLVTQAANTGTLFNINAAAFSLFRGVTISAVGNLSVQKVLKAVAKARNRGADGDLSFFTSANGYAALLADLNAARRVDYSYKTTKLDSGAEAITLHSSNGSIDIIEHPFVKDTDALLLPKEEVMRPAVSDIVDNLNGEQLSVMASTGNFFEFRVWTSQATFLAAPAHSVYMTGLTYA